MEPTHGGTGVLPNFRLVHTDCRHFGHTLLADHLAQLRLGRVQKDDSFAACVALVSSRGRGLPTVPTQLVL